MPCPYGGLGLFRVFWRLAGDGEAGETQKLGSFRIFGLPQVRCGVDWVRFAYLGRGAGWGRGKLGSFRIFGSADGGGGANWVRFA